MPDKKKPIKMGGGGLIPLALVAFAGLLLLIAIL